MKTVPLPHRVRRARRIGFAAWAGLLALELVWHALWSAPIDVKALTIAIVPLLLPLLALRRPSRALLWAGIVALFYFAHGVSDAWVTPALRAPALLEAALSVILVGALGVSFPKRAKPPVPNQQPLP